jgi:hypothetical protein
MSYGVGIGLFSCALSVYAFSRRGWRSVAVAVSAGAFAISIYQSLVLALIVVYALWMLDRVWSDDQASERQSPLLADGWLVLVVFGASVLVYFLVSRFALIASGVKTAYISEFFDPRFLLQHPSAVLSGTAHHAAQIFGGDSNVYVTSNPWLVVTIGFSLVFVLRRFARLPRARGLIAAALIFVAVLSPFALHLANHGTAPMRSMVALPFLFWGITYFGLRSTPLRIRRAARAVVIMTVLHFALTANRLFGSAYLALEADRIFVAGLIERMQIVLSEAPGVQYFELVGSHQPTPSHLMDQHENLGASFLEWDEGNPGRVIGYLATLGYNPHLVRAPDARRVQLTVIGQMMPSWPAAGSVVVDADTLVVKLGPYTKAQKARICRTDRLPVFCEGS